MRHMFSASESGRSPCGISWHRICYENISVHSHLLTDSHATCLARDVCLSMASMARKYSSDSSGGVELLQLSRVQQDPNVDETEHHPRMSNKKAEEASSILGSDHGDIPVCDVLHLISSHEAHVYHYKPAKSIFKETLSFTANEEEQVINKLNRHLVLFLALLYMLSFLGM